jgi:hypothetical protein
MGRRSPSGADVTPIPEHWNSHFPFSQYEYTSNVTTIKRCVSLCVTIVYTVFTRILVNGTCLGFH